MSEVLGILRESSAHAPFLLEDPDQLWLILRNPLGEVFDGRANLGEMLRAVIADRLLHPLHVLVVAAQTNFLVHRVALEEFASVLAAAGVLVVDLLAHVGEPEEILAVRSASAGSRILPWRSRTRV